MYGLLKRGFASVADGTLDLCLLPYCLTFRLVSADFP